MRTYINTGRVSTQFFTLAELAPMPSATCETVQLASPGISEHLAPFYTGCQNLLAPA